MAVLKIARMGHPVLLRRAEPVADPRDAEIRRLVRDMIETMEDSNGVGLAAPQVHLPLRLFVYTVPPERDGAEGDGPAPVSVLVNPVLEPVGDAAAEHWEGCLSIPGLRGLVRRPARIRFRGLDGDGQPVAGEATGFQAVVMQHEYDHLDGVLYPSRMADLSRWGFNEELDRFGRPPAAAGGGEADGP